MVRISEDRLKGISLRILDDAVREGIEHKVPRSLGLRLALAYLASQSDCDREPFDEFWRALTERGDQARYNTLRTALLGIHYQTGLIDRRQYIAGKVALPVPTKKGWR